MYPLLNVKKGVISNFLSAKRHGGCLSKNQLLGITQYLTIYFTCYRLEAVNFLIMYLEKRRKSINTNKSIEKQIIPCIGTFKSGDVTFAISSVKVDCISFATSFTGSTDKILGEVSSLKSNYKISHSYIRYKYKNNV